jgi:hypothetical protein
MVVIIILAFCPYRLVGSPNSTICIIDGSNQPLSGLRVTRSWDTSEGQKGQDEAVTDSRGAVNFKRVAVSMSLLKRLTKPLLIFVPAACGPGWEVYGSSEFHVYWPDGYALKFDAANWKKVNEVYKDRDGVCVRVPEDMKQYNQENYVAFYFFNKPKDFDYTLTIYRKNTP